MGDSRIQNFPERERLVKLASELLETAAALPDQPVDVEVTAKLVTQEMLCRITGYTPARLDALRRRGTMIQGVHYIVTPQSKIDWDIEEFDNWRRGNQQAATPESLSVTGTSGSKCSTEDSGSTSGQSFQQRLEDCAKRRSSGKRSTTKAVKAS